MLRDVNGVHLVGKTSREGVQLMTLATPIRERLPMLKETNGVLSVDKMFGEKMSSMSLPFLPR